ncbi:MAG: hypothetical protein LCH80_10760, partial [Proteobacteria bacterium]|nr:hypothetical protein [Pseudomonadota bacterium]
MSEKSEAPPPATTLQAGPVPVRVLGLPLTMGLARTGADATANSNSRVALAPVEPAPSRQGDTVRADARRDGQPAPEPAQLRPKPQAEAPRTAHDGDRGGKGGGGGGRGGGSGRGTPIEQRLGDRDFKQVLGQGLSDARHNLMIVAVFSVVVNTLVLAVPIYLFQMSDRVLTSRSLDTLVMLSLIVMVAI